MLVLTRKTDESIFIGEDIKISVLGVDGERVRIGIDAPRSMRIFRQELLDETRLQNQAATQVNFVQLDFSKAAEADTESD